MGYPVVETVGDIGRADIAIRHGDIRHGDIRHGELRQGDMRMGDLRQGDMRHPVATRHPVTRLEWPFSRVFQDQDPNRRPDVSTAGDTARIPGLDRRRIHPAGPGANLRSLSRDVVLSRQVVARQAYLPDNEDEDNWTAHSTDRLGTTTGAIRASGFGVSGFGVSGLGPSALAVSSHGLSVPGRLIERSYMEVDQSRRVTGERYGLDARFAPDARFGDTRYADARFGDPRFGADSRFAGDGRFGGEPRFGAYYADGRYAMEGSRYGHEQSKFRPIEVQRYNTGEAVKYGDMSREAVIARSEGFRPDFPRAEFPRADVGRSELSRLGESRFAAQEARYELAEVGRHTADFSRLPVGRSVDLTRHAVEPPRHMADVPRHIIDVPGQVTNVPRQVTETLYPPASYYTPPLPTPPSLHYVAAEDFPPIEFVGHAPSRAQTHTSFSRMGLSRPPATRHQIEPIKPEQGTPRSGTKAPDPSAAGRPAAAAEGVTADLPDVVDSAHAQTADTTPKSAATKPVASKTNVSKAPAESVSTRQVESSEREIERSSRHVPSSRQGESSRHGESCRQVEGSSRSLVESRASRQVEGSRAKSSEGRGKSRATSARSKPETATLTEVTSALEKVLSSHEAPLLKQIEAVVGKLALLCETLVKETANVRETGRGRDTGHRDRTAYRETGCGRDSPSLDFGQRSVEGCRMSEHGSVVDRKKSRDARRKRTLLDKISATITERVISQLRKELGSVETPRLSDSDVSEWPSADEGGRKLGHDDLGDRYVPRLGDVVERDDVPRLVGSRLEADRERRVDVLDTGSIVATSPRVGKCESANRSLDEPMIGIVASQSRNASAELHDLQSNISQSTTAPVCIPTPAEVRSTEHKSTEVRSTAHRFAEHRSRHTEEEQTDLGYAVERQKSGPQTKLRAEETATGRMETETGQVQSITVSGMSGNNTLQQKGLRSEVMYTLRIDTICENETEKGSANQGSAKQGSNSGKQASTRQLEVIRISVKPTIFVIPELLTSNECEHIINSQKLSVGHFETDSVWRSCNVAVKNFVTSTDPCISRVLRRMAALARKDIKSLAALYAVVMGSQATVSVTPESLFALQQTGANIPPWVLVHVALTGTIAKVHTSFNVETHGCLLFLWSHTRRQTHT